MNFRKVIYCLSFVAIIIIFAACTKSGMSSTVSGTSPTLKKTEIIPADGGDLGKAFVELKDSLKAADKVRTGKLLDPNAWHMDNKEPEWFAPISERLTQYSAIGGRRQGDRATLFVVNKVPYYAILNATYAAGAWKFDSPLPMGSSFSSVARDCKAFPTRFPCAAVSAPDAMVSGAAESHRTNPETKSLFPPATLFDGLAVRMVDPQTKALKSTWIVLSGTGINPQMVALSEEPDNVARWLSYPVLTLDVAPDGKSAKGKYFDGISPKDFDVTDGLSIDMKKPNRISGRLKMDLKDTAKFDIVFDISTASDCLADQYHCGE